MSDQPDNIILILLRWMDAKLDRLAEDVHELKAGVTALGHHYASMSRRQDCIDGRLARVERRLDLTEATA